MTIYKERNERCIINLFPDTAHRLKLYCELTVREVIGLIDRVDDHNHELYLVYIPLLRSVYSWPQQEISTMIYLHSTP